MNKLNNINDDNFERSIRQHLSNATVEPSPELWERIEGSLEADVVPVTSLLGRMRWAMAAVAAVVVIALGSLFWLELDRSSLALPEEVFAILEESEEIEEIEEVEVPEEIILEAEPISLAENLPRGGALRTSKKVAEVIDVTEAEDIADVAETIEVAEVEPTPEQPSQSTAPTKEQSTQQPQGENLSSYYNMISQAKGSTKSRLNLSLMVAGSTLSSASNSILSAFSAQDLVASDNVAMNGDILNPGTTNGNNSDGFDNAGEGEGEGEEEGETKATSSTKYDGSEVLNYNGSYDIEHQVPVTFAVSVSYELTERWSLESGLSYSYLASTVSTNYSSSMKQQLEFIGVPLRFNYQFYATPKFSLYAGAGAQIERCISAKINSISATEKDWHWSLGGSIGAQYHINDWLGIYAEPEAAYYLTKTSLSTIRTESPLSYNIRFGLRFSFGASR